jgi:hypothetical protein
MRLAVKYVLSIAAFAAFVPAAAAADINVMFAPEFAEELEEDYGLREGAYLSERVREDLDRALAKAGADPARVDVTIIDAKPSRPTFKQGADTPGLDLFRSVSLGGMKIQAVAYDEAGNATEPFEYDWYENDIRNAGLTTWQDARRASKRFASRFAETVE